MASSNTNAIRTADILLRNNGGRAVLLRMPAPAVPNNDAEQLGLATPLFQDVVLAPVVFHKANSVKKLLVSASVVEAIAGTLAFDSADVLFETAAGVVIDDVLYTITDSFCSQSMGRPYCWWLTLERPVR
jgi:hypothetical protein